VYKNKSYTQAIFMILSFAAILKKLMYEKKLNQLSLAKMLGIRQSQVSNWVNGKSLPGYYSLKILCTKLHVSADFLLGNKNNREL
jgi:transcriptional regulator with XRE-family HTH domain